MNAIKSYLDSLQARERLLVISGAIFLAILLPHQLIWTPLMERADRLKGQVEQQQEQLNWMQSAAKQVKQAQGRVNRSSGGSLLSQVERTAKQARLREAIRKIQPEGDRGVRVWMEKAAFDDVLLWLNNLHRRQGLDVADLSVERLDESGRVNLRLLLESL